MRKLILVSLVAIFLISCNNNYKYNTQLKRYFKTELNIDVKNKNYVVLFIGGCGDCMVTDLLSFSSFPVKDNTEIVIVGKSNNNKIDSLINVFANNYNISFDENETIFNYETGIVVNSFVIAQNNSIEEVINIKQKKWKYVYEKFYN